MALLDCKECGGKVSANAENCPHCGEPNATEKSTKKAKGVGATRRFVVGTFCLAVGVGGFIWATQHSPNISLDQALMAGEGHWVLKKEVYTKILIAAGVFTFAGVFSFIQGFMAQSKSA